MTNIRFSVVFAFLLVIYTAHAGDSPFGAPPATTSTTTQAPPTTHASVQTSTPLAQPALVNGTSNPIHNSSAKAGDKTAMEQNVITTTTEHPTTTTAAPGSNSGTVVALAFSMCLLVTVPFIF